MLLLSLSQGQESLWSGARPYLLGLLAHHKACHAAWDRLIQGLQENMGAGCAAHRASRVCTGLLWNGAEAAWENFCPGRGLEGVYSRKYVAGVHFSQVR